MSEEEQQYHYRRVMSPEIVEIGEDSRSIATKDVYVAVGKDDLDVLKWALRNAVHHPGTRVFLLHVFPPMTSIPTPIGKLSRNQVSQEQVKAYIREENNRRHKLLAKYIHLCNEAKVEVETALIESDLIAKAILDLIPVLNIITLVMGTKRAPSSRWLRKGTGKGEFVQTNAPDFCEVTIVYDGKKVMDGQQVTELVQTSSASSHQKTEMRRHTEKNFFECVLLRQIQLKLRCS